MRITTLPRAAAVLAAAAVLLAAGPPAYAHDQVLAQSPAADAALDASPRRVSLTFTDTPLDIGAVVMVVDPAGRNWAAGEPRISGATVEQPVGALPDGHYQVRWRVVSADGHPISESYPFTVGDAAGAPTFTRQAPPAGPDGPDNANLGEFALTDAADAADADAEDSTVRTVLVAAAGAVAGLLLFAAGLFTAGQRKRSTTKGTP
ncbi:copper resistance protein CopC [Actinokineospora guangxiensis]|uniref:Copper resistance protein CopC n=1 Tax=Actinokineospora guangxiensis TaxID=1490288 RepID=A0ABW0EQN4_9PSEU